MNTRTYASISVFAALGFLTSLPAHALGLGQLELSSALNEPFKGEIAVTSLTENEAGNLQVQLASNEEFERAGLIKTSVLSQLKFEIIEKNGKTVIAITSKLPVKEPLIDFLLSATAGSGHLIREYAVLLDPPNSVFKQKIATVAAPAPIAKSAPSEVKQVTTTSSYQYNEPSLTPSTATSYGPVRNRDTLWDVALKTRPENTISVHQMMLALLKENGSAFIKNNINGLKAGYTLSIPSSEQIKQLTKAQARAAVTEQNQLWANRNAMPAPVEVIAETEAMPMAAASDEAETESEAVKEAGVTEPTARLQLLSPNDENALADGELSGLGSTELKQLSEQLTLAQETIESQAQENVDIKSRMAAMEEQIQTLRKLISIQDPEWAKLQSKLEQEGVTADSEGSLDQAAEDLLATMAEEQHLAEVTELESESTEANEQSELLAESEMMDADQTAHVDPMQASSEDAQKVAASDLAMAPAEDAASTSLLDKAKAILAEYKVEAASAGLLLLIAILLLLRRGGKGGGVITGRQKTWDEAVKELEKDVQIPNFTANKPVTSQAVAAEDDSDALKTVTELVQDADIFVSYGDLEKAKLSLEEARKDEPENQTVIHKLLFVLFKQEQTDEFVALASEFEANDDSLEWAEIAAWGRELAPENEIFRELIADVPVESEEISEENNEDTVLSFEQPDNKASIEIDDGELEFNIDQAEEAVSEVDDDLLSFNPGFASSSSNEEAEDFVPEDSEELAEVEQADEDFLSFDLSGDTEQQQETPELEVVTESDEIEFSTDDSDNEIQLDEENDLAEISEDELASATAELSGEADNNELEFDLGDIDEIDEAETKLDLASAYIDMGDPEGARAILEEVAKDGNDDQKTRAQSILNDLS